MNLETFYRDLWNRKLDRTQQPPSKQRIDRVEWVAELMGKPESLIDFGCGAGAMLGAAYRKGVASILGVDFAGTLLEWLKDQEGGRYLVMPCDLNQETAPSSDAKWDVATSTDVIEHLIDPHHMLAEMYRVLKPGGVAFVATPNASSWRRVEQLSEGEMFRTCGDPGLKDGGHLSYWGPVDLKAALLKSGFQKVAIEYRATFPAPKGKSVGEWSNYSYLIAKAEK